MALNSPRSRRVLHGAERDSTDIFTRKLRVITSRAGAPVRRCPAPGCYSITTGTSCPKCGHVLVTPEPDHAAELRAAPGALQPFHPSRACIRCGDAYVPTSPRALRCQPCARVVGRDSRRYYLALQLLAAGKAIEQVAASVNQSVSELRALLLKEAR